MPKFMQSLGPDSFQRLAIEAKARDVTVQSLIRTVIVPEWLKTIPASTLNSQTATVRPLLQQPTLLSRTGLVTRETGRTFLNAIGQRKP
jgi:hypothetical protein